MIYGIGRNYHDHAKELGNPVPQGDPVVFLKPPESAVPTGSQVTLPKFSTNVHYEVELAFRFGSNLEVADICVANDLTARDYQRKAQEGKLPWAVAKGFKQSCGLGNWVSAQGVDLANLELQLELNGELKQRGFTKDLIFDVPRLVSYLTTTFPIAPGDIVLTGTPAGVGPIQSGDEIKAQIMGLSFGHWTYI